MQAYLRLTPAIDDYTPVYEVCPVYCKNKKAKIAFLYSTHMCYNRKATYLPDKREGGEIRMEGITVSLLVSIAAGIICHYICKWLDEHKK